MVPVLISLILIGGSVVWYLVYRAGNPTFWKVAASNPDAAYEWFVEEDCWVVIEPETPSGRPPPPRRLFTGPFFLIVPKTGGRRVALYCRHDQIEDSQSRFLSSLSRAAGINTREDAT